MGTGSQHAGPVHAPSQLMRYLAEAQQIWRTQVPRAGQADTVQGELLRAVEKFRHEAQVNGNINWDVHFDLLLAFLKSTLLDPAALPGGELASAAADLDRLADHDRPVTGDDIYDRLGDAVVLWARAHPEPVPHRHDPRQRR